MEQEETTACPVCGGNNIYEVGDEYLGCLDCHRLNGGADVRDLNAFTGMTLAEITRRYFEVNTATQEAIGMDGLEPASLVAVIEQRERQLIDAAQLVAPLQERCELLGRALAAVWSLVGEEDQRAIMALLDAPAGAGKTMLALSLVQMLERKGASMEEVA